MSGVFGNNLNFWQKHFGHEKVVIIKCTRNLLCFTFQGILESTEMLSASSVLTYLSALRYSWINIVSMQNLSTVGTI